MIGGGMSHRGFMGRNKNAFCPYLPGLYSESEIDDLVFIDGYIPVYDADEFDKIRTGAVEEMGGCTKWGGNYTTGSDKKYVQINNINLSSQVGWTPLEIGTGTYDGNELNLSFLTASQGIFILRGGVIDNCRVQGATISGGNGNDGILVDVGHGTIQNSEIDATSSINSVSGVGSILGVESQGTATITNCINYASVTATSGAAGGICGGSSAISNCINYGNVTATSGAGGITPLQTNSTLSSCQNFGIISSSGANGPAGGITGRVDGSSIVEDCSNFGDVSTSGIRIGGIAGGILGEGIIRRCKTVNASITTTVNGTNPGLGGIIGYVLNGTGTRPLVQECEVINCTITGNTQDEVGGICGSNFNTYLTIENCRVDENTVITGRTSVGGILGRNNSASTTITNSYSAASVSGTSAVGGAVGTSSAGTYNDIYWDTNTSGVMTSAAGTGQTTSALQTPTSNTGIYANYDPLIWDFGTSSEYPKLINIP